MMFDPSVTTMSEGERTGMPHEDEKDSLDGERYASWEGQQRLCCSPSKDEKLSVSQLESDSFVKLCEVHEKKGFDENSEVLGDVKSAKTLESSVVFETFLSDATDQPSLDSILEDALDASRNERTHTSMSRGESLSLLPSTLPKVYPDTLTYRKEQTMNASQGIQEVFSAEQTNVEEGSNHSVSNEHPIQMLPGDEVKESVDLPTVQSSSSSFNCRSQDSDLESVKHQPFSSSSSQIDQQSDDELTTSNGESSVCSNPIQGGKQEGSEQDKLPMDATHYKRLSTDTRPSMEDPLSQRSSNANLSRLESGLSTKHCPMDHLDSGLSLDWSNGLTTCRTHLGTGDRLLVVANRLPMTVCRSNTEKKGYTFSLSSGGLVSGLRGIKSIDFVWIGWPGGEVSEEDHEYVTTQCQACDCHPVYLNKDIIELFYNGFCNNILWPLIHYIPPPIEIGWNDTYAEQWNAYYCANVSFVEAILEVYDDNDIVWVHDYHLMLVPKLLRARKPSARIGWFLHTPFPSQEIFRMLPYRTELLTGLLSANLIGFHMYDYLRHFINSCVQLLGLENTAQGIDASPVGGVFVYCAVIPIGIESEQFTQMLKDPGVKRAIRRLNAQFGKRKVILGVDRLDYMKGLPHKLNAFDRFLELHPEWMGCCVFVQLAVPSRTVVPEYQRLKSMVHELVGRINGKRGNITHVPVHYLDQSLSLDELVALYRVADVALISSIRDGMNLVAYEYIACQAGKSGVLILSEFTGASQSLGAGSVRINPWNLDETANAIFRALTMSKAERCSRHQYTLNHVRVHTSQKWAQVFIESLRDASERNEEVRASVPQLLSWDTFLDRFTAAKRRLILIDLVDALTPARGNRGMPMKKFKNLIQLPKDVLEALNILSQDENTVVIIVSAHPASVLERLFSQTKLCLAAEKGCVYRTRQQVWVRYVEEVCSAMRETCNYHQDLSQDLQSHGAEGGGEGEKGSGEIHVEQGLDREPCLGHGRATPGNVEGVATIYTEWIPGVKKVFEFFERRTPGSYTERTTGTLTWYWDDTLPDFGKQQSRDLLVHLSAGPLSNTSSADVEVVVGSRFIEVRSPQCSRSRLLQCIMETEFECQDPLDCFDFVVCIANFPRRDEDIHWLFESQSRPQSSSTSSEHHGCASSHELLKLPSGFRRRRFGSSREDPMNGSTVSPGRTLALGATRTLVEKGAKECSQRLEGCEAPEKEDEDDPPAKPVVYSIAIGSTISRSKYRLVSPYHVQALVKHMARHCAVERKKPELLGSPRVGVAHETSPSFVSHEKHLWSLRRSPKHGIIEDALSPSSVEQIFASKELHGHHPVTPPFFAPCSENLFRLDPPHLSTSQTHHHRDPPSSVFEHYDYGNYVNASVRLQPRHPLEATSSYSTTSCRTTESFEGVKKLVKAVQPRVQGELYGTRSVYPKGYSSTSSLCSGALVESTAEHVVKGPAKRFPWYEKDEQEFQSRPEDKSCRVEEKPWSCGVTSDAVLGPNSRSVQGASGLATPETMRGSLRLPGEGSESSTWLPAYWPPPQFLNDFVTFTHAPSFVSQPSLQHVSVPCHPRTVRNVSTRCGPTMGVAPCALEAQDPPSSREGVELEQSRACGVGVDNRSSPRTSFGAPRASEEAEERLGEDVSSPLSTSSTQGQAKRERSDQGHEGVNPQVLVEEVSAQPSSSESEDEGYSGRQHTVEPCPTLVRSIRRQPLPYAWVSHFCPRKAMDNGLRDAGLHKGFSHKTRAQPRPLDRVPLVHHKTRPIFSFAGSVGGDWPSFSQCCVSEKEYDKTSSTFNTEHRFPGDYFCATTEPGSVGGGIPSSSSHQGAYYWSSHEMHGLLKSLQQQEAKRKMNLNDASLALLNAPKHLKDWDRDPKPFKSRHPHQSKRYPTTLQTRTVADLNGAASRSDRPPKRDEADFTAHVSWLASRPKEESGHQASHTFKTTTPFFSSKVYHKETASGATGGPNTFGAPSWPNDPVVPKEPSYEKPDTTQPVQGVVEESSCRHARHPGSPFQTLSGYPSLGEWSGRELLGNESTDQVFSEKSQMGTLALVPGTFSGPTEGESRGLQEDMCPTTYGVSSPSFAGGPGYVELDQTVHSQAGSVEARQNPPAYSSQGETRIPVSPPYLTGSLFPLCTRPLFQSSGPRDDPGMGYENNKGSSFSTHRSTGWPGKGGHNTTELMTQCSKELSRFLSSSKQTGYRREDPKLRHTVTLGGEIRCPLVTSPRVSSQNVTATFKGPFESPQLSVAGVHVSGPTTLNDHYWSRHSGCLSNPPVYVQPNPVAGYTVSSPPTDTPAHRPTEAFHLSNDAFSSTAVGAPPLGGATDPLVFPHSTEGTYEPNLLRSETECGPSTSFVPPCFSTGSKRLESFPSSRYLSSRSPRNDSTAYGSTHQGPQTEMSKKNPQRGVCGPPTILDMSKADRPPNNGP